MSLRLAFLSLLALLVSACGQSNGSEKKGGPGMGFPPPEVNVATVMPRTLQLASRAPQHGHSISRMLERIAAIQSTR